jgi:hypothetical protein
MRASAGLEGGELAEELAAELTGVALSFLSSPAAIAVALAERQKANIPIAKLLICFSP